MPDHPPQHVREFSAPDSPPLDFVFTLSDTAAGEAPPMWPGHPITAHWRCADPEQYEDATERRMALYVRAPSSNVGCVCSPIYRSSRWIA